ncbi:MAG: ABC transporter substrate-binding protein [Bacteroidota bacterium]
MKNNLLHLVLLLVLSACAQNEAAPIEDGTQQQSTTAQAQDYFEHKVQAEYAQHFELSYHGNYKLVKTDATFYPNGKQEEGKSRQDIIVLVQKGTEAPPLTGALQDAQVVFIPIDKVAVNVQHSESFLRELGLVERINTIGGLYSFDNTMRNKALNGELGQVGYSWHSPPNIEVLLERQPKVFLMTLASMDHTQSLEKCRQLGIPTVAVFDWAEQDYLARAEWVKFYSLFFNAEEQANIVFQEIANRIDELKALAAEAPEESALWGYYTSKSKWLVQLSNFPAQYMRDANLKNVLLGQVEANANGSQQLSSEQLLILGQEAEHWVIGDIHGAPLPQETIMSSFQAWNSGQLYHNMKRVDPKSNTSDWYATAIVRPDTVLADLIKLAHPELLPDHHPVFMGVFDKETALN